MFGKLNTRILVITLISLAALWWLGGRMSGEQQRSFRDTLLRTDTATLQSFAIVPAPWKKMDTLRFRRDGKSWNVTTHGKTVMTDPDPMNELLGSFRDLRTIRVAGKFGTVDPHYEIADSSADRLVIDAPDGKHVVLVGQGRGGADAFTYMCMPPDQDVYAVQGKLGVFMDNTATDWMPKQLVIGDPKNWDRVTFTFPTDTGYTMVNDGRRWSIDGVPCDQEKVVEYLESLARSRGQRVIDPSDTLNAVPAFKLVVEDRTRSSPIMVSVLAKVDHYIVRSSLDPSIVMPFDKAREVPRMFRPRAVFLPSNKVTRVN